LENLGLLHVAAQVAHTRRVQRHCPRDPRDAEREAPEQHGATEAVQHADAIRNALADVESEDLET
jgi:hypothetical protein